jgi:hypothetical protein
MLTGIIQYPLGGNGEDANALMQVGDHLLP